MVKYMNKKINPFSDDNTYKLYRDVQEILHPVISKRNISDYQIIFDEKYLPVRIFYPQKVSFINKVIIFIPGISEITECQNKYLAICKEMALATNHLVIGLDYFQIPYKYPKLLNNIYNFLKYLINKLKYAGILEKNIILLGDSFGANLISSIIFKNIKDQAFTINKVVLLYPILSGEYFDESQYKSLQENEKYNLLLLKHLQTFYKKYTSSSDDLKSSVLFPLKNNDFTNHPKTLIITGNLDPLRDEGYAYYEKLQHFHIPSTYYNLNFENHGFLKDIDYEMKKELYTILNNYLEE